jgi:uncharacterized protein YcbK (DUF882 family)
MTASKKLSRRRFLSVSAAALGATTALLTVPAQARTFFNYPARRLTFFNTHTNETFSGAYWNSGNYDTRVMQNFYYALRDHRTNQMARMDPRLFDLLHNLQARLQNFSTIDVISGYRSPASNSFLAAKSDGVAKGSYHMKGQAIDIRIPGIDTSYIHQAALKMKAGGVGYYASSDFVHVDTGPVRTW